MFQCCFHPSTNEFESVFPPLICVNNLSVKKTGQHGKTRTSWTDWATRTRHTGSKSETLANTNHKELTMHICVFKPNITILYTIAGWSGATGCERTKRTSWRRNAGVKGLRFCYIICVVIEYSYSLLIWRPFVLFRGIVEVRVRGGWKGLKVIWEILAFLDKQ